MFSSKENKFEKTIYFELVVLFELSKEKRPPYHFWMYAQVLVSVTEKNMKSIASFDEKEKSKMILDLSLNERSTQMIAFSYGLQLMFAPCHFIFFFL